MSWKFFELIYLFIIQNFFNKSTSSRRDKHGWLKFIKKNKIEMGNF